MSWIISGNHIAVREGNTIVHLEAVDVYDALHDGNIVFCGKDQGALEAAFPDMDFSPLSRSAVIVLSSDGPDIFLSVEADGIFVDFCTGTVDRPDNRRNILALY